MYINYSMSDYLSTMYISTWYLMLYVSSICYSRNCDKYDSLYLSDLQIHGVYLGFLHVILGTKDDKVWLVQKWSTFIISDWNCRILKKFYIVWNIYVIRLFLRYILYQSNTLLILYLFIYNALMLEWYNLNINFFGVWETHVRRKYC